MLVLHSTSRCDVCLLEYTWETSARVPHAIACGHIFCRDCLYATTPPLCPLCRKNYQPAKIKKLHVDRPENVDEAREVELGRQQLDLLEQLVEVWDVELREGTHHEGGGDREIRSETEDTRILSGSRLAIPGDETDEHIGGLLGLREEESFLDRSNDVEQILDGIAGAPGIGRGFLERWGSTLPAHGHEGGPIVTLRDAQKGHATEVLRRVDVWLEGKDEESAVALRKSRLFFAQHLALREALKDALQFAKSLNEERCNLLRDLQELEAIKQGMQAAGEELQRYNALVEAISIENHNLKARLSKRSRNASPALRNPLPRPPEPISTEHVPTFAQAISEGSGSPYHGSVYSPAGSSTGVRFAVSSDSPDRARERYLTTDDGPGQSANPNGTQSRSGRKKGKGRDGSHYSYRDDSGYFEDENRWQQPSSGPTYPTSAPADLQGFTSDQRPNEYGTNVGHDQNRKHNSNHVTRSGSKMQYEGSSQALDVFSATSHYLREYSAGFVNGQAAALGVGPFAPPPPPPQLMTSAPARTSSRVAADTTGSIVYTSDSVEDAAGQFRELLPSASQSMSPVRSGHRSTASQISNPQLASILSSPPRRHMSLVSLPSVSSQGQPSPSLSNNQRPNYTSSHASINILLAHEEDSPGQSVASSGLNPPPSLPHDPEAAAAIIADRLTMAQYTISGRVSPSNRSQRTSVSSGWGTVYSNARSNSLISGLRGLPSGQGDAHDSASIRTRGTRFSMDLADIDDRDSVRDSRRESHASFGARSNMSEIEEEDRDGSPVRPVHSMVGVLPLEDSDPNSQQHEGDFARGSASTNRMGSNPDMSPHFQRSSTAVDRRMASDATVWNSGFGTTHSSQSRPQPGAHHQSRQTESQAIAANTDWVSTQNLNTSSGTTVQYPEYEYERSGTSHSSHQNRRVTSRERRSNRDEDEDRHRRPAATHRSQTSMGVSSSLSGSGSSSWSYDHDSNYQYRSSRAHNRSHEPISPTSHPSGVQPSSRLRERDRDVDQERSTRSRTHHHGHSSSLQSNTRPSLLTRDSSSAFPVSVESTDDERHPRINPNRSRTAMNTNDGRNTRMGRQTNNSSLAISATTTMGNDSSLPSFGTQNALGLELVTTANGINAPTPVSRSSTQGFLRSFSQGDP